MIKNSIYLKHRGRQFKDPFFSKVVLLAHMNGTNGSTVFTDSSSTHKTITAFGNAQIDTAQYKFGGASGLFDGNGDYLSLAGSADFNMNGSDFTVDFWWRSAATSRQDLTAIGGTKGIISITPSTGNVLIYAGATVINTNIAPLTTNQWYFLALSYRSPATWEFYIDGTLSASANDASVYFGGTNTTYIGRNDVNWINGNIDDFRITKGVARYTSNFTPPTTAFPNQ